MVDWPKELKCLHCNYPNLSITQTKGPNSSPPFLDYTWRNLRCDACRKRIQWGEPVRVGLPHVVMTKTPKPDGAGKTANVEYALPIGATLRHLKLNEVKIKMTHARDMYMLGRGNRPLSPAEVEELTRILEFTKAQYMGRIE